MAVRYGFNITASDMRDMLLENERRQDGVRSWNKLFGNAALGYKGQRDALKTDYSSTIAQAYKANFDQRNAILGSGHNTGATNAFLADNRADLLAAYDAYRANYAENASALTENYNAEVNAYNEELNTRASKFASLYNKAYDYLSQELSGAYQTIAGNRIDFLTDQGLGWARNGDTVKSWNDLSRSLFDQNRQLTATGKDFYNKIFNGIPQAWILDDDKSESGTRAMRGFDEWLSDVDPELRDWWISADAYNTFDAGRNKDAAESYLGIKGMGTPDLSIKSEGAIDAPTVQGDSHATWSIRNLGTGRKSGKDRNDRFTLSIGVTFNESGKSSGGTEYKVKTVDDVDETLSKKLNVRATGSEATAPSADGEYWFGSFLSRPTSNAEGKANKIVEYEGKLYIYTKNGWRSIVSNDDNVDTQTVVDAFLKKT